jgi:hypothetical protein
MACEIDAGSHGIDERSETSLHPRAALRLRRGYPPQMPYGINPQCTKTTPRLPCIYPMSILCLPCVYPVSILCLSCVYPTPCEVYFLVYFFIELMSFFR